MGILGSIVKGITGPIRAVGKALTGDFKGAVGALGDTVKPLSFVAGATGVGLPLAAAMGAAGGAMQKFDDEDFSLGSTVKGAVGGAAVGAGGHGVGQILSRGVPALASSGAGGPIVPGGAPVSAVGNAVSSAASSVSTGASNVGSFLGKTAGDVGGFLAKNPAMVADVLGTGADVYGASQAGAAYDRQLTIDEEDRRKQRELQSLELLFSMQNPGRF